MNYWLVKQEPSKYNWEQLLKDKETCWDGVRNYQARNHLQAMRKNDLTLIYHSVTGKQVMGVAVVSKEHAPDPTTEDARWVAVHLRALRPLVSPVTLEAIKSHPGLQDIALLRQSRLSVMPLTEKQFHLILHLGKTAI